MIFQGEQSEIRSQIGILDGCMLTQRSCVTLLVLVVQVSRESPLPLQWVCCAAPEIAPWAGSKGPRSHSAVQTKE